MARWFPWRRRAPAPAGARPTAERTVADEEAITRVDGPAPPAYADEVVVEEPAGPPPPPQREIWPWLLALLVLVLAGLGALYFLARDDDDEGAQRTVTVATATRPAEITVPRVIGLREAQAAAQLSAAGFKLASERRTSNRPRDVVIDQEPEPRAKAAEGSTVTIFVSRGYPRGVVPDVTGDAVATATRELQAAGLRSQVRRVFSTEPVNVVVAQSPAQGETVRKGTLVTLSVSRGARPVPVPSVTGESESQAVVTLGNAGLRARVVRVPSQEPEGTVVAQNPQAGATARRGTFVRLNVSSGAPTTTARGTTTAPTGTTTAPTGTTPTQPRPLTATIPDVVGSTLRQAVQSLHDAGLKASVTWVPSQEPARTVIAQARQAGTTVRRGSTMQINVSLGATPGPQAAVPDVVGQDEGAARAALERAGFTVQVYPQETTVRSQEGTVLDQTPEPATQAPTGSQITLYIGSLTRG